MGEKQIMVAAVIGAARGLQGEVGLDIRTDRLEECFFVGAEFSTDSQQFPVLTVEGMRLQKGRATAFFSEISGRDEAESARGVKLFTSEVPESDAWYSHELEGLQVESVSGDKLGLVRELQLGKAQDLLVIEYEGRSVRVPFVEALVPEVNINERKVIVNPPEGLFGDDEQIG